MIFTAAAAIFWPWSRSQGNCREIKVEPRVPKITKVTNLWLPCFLSSHFMKYICCFLSTLLLLNRSILVLSLWKLLVLNNIMVMVIRMYWARQIPTGFMKPVDWFKAGLPLRVAQIFHWAILGSTDHMVQMYNFMCWPWLSSSFSFSNHSYSQKFPFYNT